MFRTRATGIVQPSAGKEWMRPSAGLLWSQWMVFSVALQNEKEEEEEKIQ